MTTPSNTLTKGLLLVLLTFAATPADAYLDPSTGSMIISAIVGLFASLVLAIKTYWYKIKGFFRRGSDEPAPEDEGS